ncbi:MAG: hypothetical protein AAFQ98_14650 [Bacteroidota bacterium]
MRTSLLEIAEIEDWVLQQGDPAQRLIMEGKLLLSPALQEQVKWQTQTYAVVRQYGQEKLREEIKAVEKELFSAPKHRQFQDRIRSIFKP